MRHVDNTFKSPTILSLCPGLLGLERGLERAIGPVRVAAYVEIEAFIIANLVVSMEKGFLAPAPIWSDVKTLDGRIFRNKIHGIIGGYPCQPFSNAGERKGLDDPRHLYPYISGIIKAAGPIWCFFENVAGHLTLGYPEVSADLRSMGYAVEAGIYSAEEAGAPHERERLFILAIKEEYLEYTCISNEWNVRGGFEQIRQEKPHTSDASSKLGNTTSSGQQECGSRIFSQLQEEDGIRVHDRLEQPSNEVAYAYAYAYGRGSGEDREQGELRTTSTKQSSSNSGYAESGENNQRRCDRWPARPGEEQYKWEEPRVKSRLGCTINGYNFREDLLRAYGNGVVEQTAEIAFLDLLRKHFDHSRTGR